MLKTAGYECDNCGLFCSFKTWDENTGIVSNNPELENWQINEGMDLCPECLKTL